jgi:hypothetical protein
MCAAHPAQVFEEMPVTDATTEPALRAMIVPVTPIEQNCTL